VREQKTLPAGELGGQVGEE